jgi:hypothetical protein
MTQGPPEGPYLAGPPTPGRPGWHSDPAGYAGFECYWDGHAWTEQRRWGDVIRRAPEGVAERSRSGRRDPRRRSKVAAAAVAVVVLVAAISLAALASGSLGLRQSPPKPYAGLLSATCSIDGFTVDAQAYYRSDGRHLELYEFLYRTLGGDPTGQFSFFDSGPDDRGAFNDVNISLVTNGQVVYSSASPDDRVSGVLFRDPVDVRVDPSAPSYVDFQAIFDVAYASDPSCAADTPPIPLTAPAA